MATTDLDLDAKGFDVLEAVYELGGEATTSDVKEYTGIEKNAIVHYRFDKLEEQGLVEMGVGEADGNRLPPKKAILTDDAGERIAAGLFSDEQPTIVERMDRLERKFDTVVEELRDVKDEFRKWKYNEETDEEIEITELVDRVESVDDSLAGIDRDELTDAIAVNDRMDEFEERFRIKGKWANHFNHVDKPSLKEGGSYQPYDVDGYDVMMAAFSDIGIEPPVPLPEGHRAAGTAADANADTDADGE